MGFYCILLGSSRIKIIVQRVKQQANRGNTFKDMREEISGRPVISYKEL